MRNDEIVQRYGHRVKAPIQKLTREATPNIQVESYLDGFPKNMGFHIRQSSPATQAEAIEVARTLRTPLITFRNPCRKVTGAERVKTGNTENKSQNPRN